MLAPASHRSAERERAVAAHSEAVPTVVHQHEPGAVETTHRATDRKRCGWRRLCRWLRLCGRRRRQLCGRRRGRHAIPTSASAAAPGQRDEQCNCDASCAHKGPFFVKTSCACRRRSGDRWHRKYLRRSPRKRLARRREQLVDVRRSRGQRADCTEPHLAQRRPLDPRIPAQRVADGRVVGEADCAAGVQRVERRQVRKDRNVQLQVGFRDVEGTFGARNGVAGIEAGLLQLRTIELSITIC